MKRELQPNRRLTIHRSRTLRAIAVPAYLALAAGCCTAYALGIGRLMRLYPHPEGTQLLFALAGMVVLTTLFVAPAFLTLVQAGAEAKKVYAALPLNRANTADLPASDSLVRASSEPRPAQETVLLRAAAEKTPTSPEQLVRATAAPDAGEGL